MTKARHTYNFPTHIRFGLGVIDELPAHLKQQGIKKPLIVTDPTCAKLPFLHDIVDMISKQGIKAEIFSGIHKNPIKSDVEQGSGLYKKLGCDAIIGIGGGAPLDVARAIALKINHHEDLFNYEDSLGGSEKVTEAIPYFVAVPTTSGTGSEVGRSTVISCDTTKQKKILFSPRLMAKAVFADPELTRGLPPPTTAATGMDALTHHIESFLSIGFHPICDGIALEGIRLVWENIEIATNKPTIEARANMMIAALMGAVAFQKGLGVVHSLAHPLSTVYDMHHGLANALMLPYGLKFNRAASRDKFKRIEALIGENDLIKAIMELNKKLHLPQKLGDVGVKAEDINTLADLAIDDVCHSCNPIGVTRQDFVTMYQDAL